MSAILDMIEDKPDQYKDLIDCPWCGGVTRPISVHGHYQCGRCRKNIDECCQGETANKKPAREGWSIFNLQI